MSDNGFNISGLFEKVKDAQKMMADKQQEAAKKTVEVSVGGGMVKVIMNGRQEVLSVQIDRDLMNPDDIETLEDLVRSAVNEANRRSREIFENEMKSVLGSMNLPGMNLFNLERLIYELRRMPSVGSKLATRIAFNIISRNDDFPLRVANAITNARQQISLCERCFGIAEESLCMICRSPNRDASVITVRGLYHVLHGIISPLDGITPDKLKITELVERAKTDGVSEIIIALSTDLEGEATTHYISEQLKDTGVRISRPGIGMPAGSDIEYTDPLKGLLYAQNADATPDDGFSRRDLLVKNSAVLNTEGRAFINGYPVLAGNRIYPKSKIVTAPDSSVTIKMPDNCIFKIGPKSVVSFEISRLFSGIFNVEAGSLTSVIGPGIASPYLEDNQVFTDSKGSPLNYNQEGAAYLFCLCNGAMDLISRETKRTYWLAEADYHNTLLLTEKERKVIVKKIPQLNHTDGELKKLIELGAARQYPLTG
ncbi:hypothetical protein CHS0354_035235 [Potamilus streckersoni]|uniref:Toprim domain-containing protein n=1 Tax=Potamilus streckersoni TaxID=2493646 RepID=A0AAE0S3A2_9BIVA|nr:hypothetical protein CHS0354_035235 [Potamilus streckersoni]